MSVRRCVAAVLTLVALGAAAGVAIAAAPAWTTYRHDASRSGIDPDSTSPLPPTQIWQTPALDGPVWGQPLVYGGAVYVATENDTVYAFNPGTGGVLWQRHLATAVPSGQLSCGDISPTVGITSTPVIDPSTRRIYVVADTWNGSSSSSIAHEMYGLNLADGSIRVGPVSVEPPGDTPKDQLQRASLALDAGKIIVGYGGNDGDCGSYHGWLVAVPEGGGGLQAYEVDSASGDSQGAIWGAGNAPAIDSAGDIWISTGNGNSGSNFDYAESVIKLDPNLARLDWWAPSNWQTLDQHDTDLGSSMPVLLPGNLVFEIGKAGVGYLLNAASLGHTGAAPVYSANVCGGSWGGAIYVNGVIYVTCSDGVHALALNTSARTFTSLSGWSVNSNASGPPIYAGGLVWAASSGVGSDNGTLYALDPNTGATSFSANLGGFEHFTTPSAGGGRLFVADDSQVTAFQIALTQSVTTPAPVISHLRVRVLRRKLRIDLVLSEPAQLTVVVAKLVAGRRVGRSCRVGARHGRRCAVARRRTTLRWRGRRGHNGFRPRMRALAPGRYLLTVTALTSSGGRSRPHAVVVVVRG
ncbi:MAG: PQQ-binding-like beta-propeller repeat protein [Solirubrobacterales bacterium]|nr:PQQ-binding-like beta-propeller repeat protein [Solirubrobacterales bacterium]